METDIQICQSRYGKKILLSIGGATSSLVLRSDQQAIQFANTLWALFDPTGYVPDGLRPFGRAVIDGFDLVKNDGSPGFFRTFATALRASFSADLAKDYFLSAAPGCVHPDASVPQSYLSQCNFVWPQFLIILLVRLVVLGLSIRCFNGMYIFLSLPLFFFLFFFGIMYSVVAVMVADKRDIGLVPLAMV